MHKIMMAKDEQKGKERKKSIKINNVTFTQTNGTKRKWTAVTVNDSVENIQN